MLYEPGDTVRIKSGAFAELMAKVETVFEEEELVEVVVKIFGRATPVQLKFQEVERVGHGRDDAGTSIFKS